MKDFEFTKVLKKIRPDWFVSRSQIFNQRKKFLINMAKNGEGRPKFLQDTAFSKKIRKLRPDWFN